MIGAKLEVETLDLNPYLPPAAEQKPAAGGAPAGGGTAPGAAAADWSDEPIDMSALRMVNADLSFGAQAIRFREIKIGKSAVHVTLNGGKLVTDLSELNLYNGTGKATLTVDASKDVPTIDHKMTLTGVQAQPLLTDAAQFKRLRGTAETQAAITTHGRSQRELVSNTNGNGAVTFKDGAITGFNLAALMRNFNPAALQKGFDDAQETDFAELAGTYTIKNGLLNNPDLHMLAPLVRLQGAGDVDLPKRTVNYKATPKLVASLEGQTGAADKSGLSVPILITGPWQNLSIQPDMASMVTEGLQDPAKVREQLDKAKDAVGGGAGGLLKGLGGGGSSPAPAPAPAPSNPSSAPDPTKAIKGLFGQ
jgi:AsmA protein